MALIGPPLDGAVDIVDLIAKGLRRSPDETAIVSAIVLISAGNARLANGMSLLHATVYAARRRVIPVLITSLTTIAGLFSLATGLARDRFPLLARDIGGRPLHYLDTADKYVVLSVEDNLVKGAAGQAVQNMKIMLGIDQTSGLLQVPYPL